MGRVVRGTFTGAGQQSAIFGASRSFNLSLKFGTGTVALERHVGGDWRAVDVFTGSAESVIDIAGAGPVEFCLNCTSHSADIEYLMAYDEDLNADAAVGPLDSLFALLTETGDEIITEDASIPLRLED